MEFTGSQVYEILDNAVDEAQAGFASEISVVLSADGSVRITDDGRGVSKISTFILINAFPFYLLLNVPL